VEGLGINVSTFIAQIVNFVILFGLLYLFAYKPILRMLDERSNKVKESMDQAESVKEQSERAEDEVKKRLEEAGKEGQGVIARAVKAGEDARQKVQQEAKKDAEALIEKARLEIQRERDEAIDDLHKEFSDLTIEAAGKVIEQSLDKKAHQDIIDKVLEESEALKKG